jgi:hypothetical protein
MTYGKILPILEGVKTIITPLGDLATFFWLALRPQSTLAAENLFLRKQEERIANELLLKLGIRVSPRTARKYMPKSPPGHPRSDQRWSTVVRNHASAILDSLAPA